MDTGCVRLRRTGPKPDAQMCTRPTRWRPSPDSACDGGGIRVRRIEQCPERIGASLLTWRQRGDKQRVAFELSEQPGRRFWGVQHVTRAGRGRASDFARQTNEYHLYHWSEVEGKYIPPADRVDHPVTYVSWFAAQAYCAWISTANQDSLARQAASGSFPPYRLPTAAEWLWVAQGGYTDVQYPWDVYEKGIHSGSSRQSSLKCERKLPKDNDLT